MANPVAGSETADARRCAAGRFKLLESALWVSMLLWFLELDSGADGDREQA
jgi:hypothetical protein